MTLLETLESYQQLVRSGKEDEIESLFDKENISLDLRQRIKNSFHEGNPTCSGIRKITIRSFSFNVEF